MKKYSEYIKMKELPKNPTFSTDKTFVAIICLNIKPEWYKLSRGERLKITRSHIKELSPHADKVARTHLRGTGLSKFDTIEILEAEDLREITRMVKAFRAGAKAAYMEVADVVTTVKGMGDLLEE